VDHRAEIPPPTLTWFAEELETFARDGGKYLRRHVARTALELIEKWIGRTRFPALADSELLVDEYMHAWETFAVAVWETMLIGLAAVAELFEAERFMSEAERRFDAEVWPRWEAAVAQDVALLHEMLEGASRTPAPTR
jgi:hypothetical protein